MKSGIGGRMTRGLRKIQQLKIQILKMASASQTESGLAAIFSGADWIFQTVNSALEKNILDGSFS